MSETRTVYGGQISQGSQSRDSLNFEAGSELSMSTSDDKSMLEDMLMTEKYISGAYDTAVFETSNQEVRQALQHIQRDEQRARRTDLPIHATARDVPAAVDPRCVVPRRGLDGLLHPMSWRLLGCRTSWSSVDPGATAHILKYRGHQVAFLGASVGTTAHIPALDGYRPTFIGQMVQDGYRGS
ncbi:MAG: spore coat protein [Bacillota bacterium]